MAHSLAVITVIHWQRHSARPVRGAFLVAPADVESPNPHAELLRGFCPIPREALRFPSLVVTSRNDPYGRLDRILELTQHWGSEQITLGNLGHINAESRLGEWDEGRKIFEAWLSRL